MNTLEAAMPQRSTWYADGLRWIASVIANAADYLDSSCLEAASLDPMPRHTSFDEIVGDMRNRANSGFCAGQRPYY
ncbi:MAG: hypothetical protein ABIR98_01715 [Usitatibacter sp.]